MKKLIVCLFLVFMIQGVFSQKKIDVKESTESIGGGSNNSFTVNIYEAGENDVQKAWKRLMKDFNAKVSTKNEIFADDAEIKSISTNKMDIYARIEKNKDSDISLIVGVDLGGAYLSSSMHSDKCKEFKKILYDFAVETTKEAIRGQLSDAEKVMKKMEREMEQLVSSNENLNKDIVNYQQKIEQAKKDLEQNGKDQESKKKEIESHKKVLEEITSKEKAIN